MHCSHAILSTLSPAPTAPPSNVTATPRVSPELGLMVSWGPPPCEHINSRSGLTGYAVRYRPQSRGEWMTAGEVNDPSTQTATITGVTELVVYEVQVAAMTAGGVGVYSSSVTASVVAETRRFFIMFHIQPSLTCPFLCSSWCSDGPQSYSRHHLRSYILGASC